jgi:[protein-PII] uridylyltransferase
MSTFTPNFSPLDGEVLLGITKHGLTDIKNRMAQAAPAYSSSKELLRQYSDVVDGLVRKAFRKAQSDVPSPSVCLLAVGGYGRAELAPHSDIDLLLLHSSSNKSDLPPLVERTLYPLWDLGFDVSCSSRSIAECLRTAQSDLHVKTGLIDGRYLDGEYEFFRTLYGLFTKKVIHRRVRQFAEALIKDLHLRHQKYRDPAFVLEPNVKEGEGGLRDFQIGRWLIRARYKTDRWDSILFPDQSRILDQSLQFLWAIRNKLHLLSGRRQDDLTFELQEKIAPILGFPSGTTGIEDMMRNYHLSTQKILNFVTGVSDRILSEPSRFRKILFFFKRGKIDPYFGISHGEVHLLDPVTFKRDPSQLMTLFKHCQNARIEMDYQTEEAVLEALPFIDDRFRTSELVNQTFLGILRKGDGVEAILKKMHDLGLLSRYLPEFSEIEGKVHYDLYHVHPVDIHSILAVGELEELRTGSYQKEYPLLTSLIREIEEPEILFLTALLHDIGKGMEGDHSLIGAELAKGIGGRMGFSSEERELIHFLVSHHLFMLETAFRRDLHDEQAIVRFGHRVKNVDQLKMLYLLTFADIKAVGPEAWTDWKNSLLMELFLKTSHFFERTEDTRPFSKENALIERLGEYLPPTIVSEYAEYLPARYLSCYPLKQIAHHIEMARFLDKEALFVEWETEEERRAKVTVCTRDRHGLFSKIAGSMFLNRLNILEAQIHTWANGVALDTFSVEDSTAEAKRRLQQFKKDLEDILRGAALLKDLISKKKETHWVQQKVIPKVSAEVKANNQDSDFYTIVEVTGEDRLGILYEITQALTDHGCDIHFARISTLGNGIVDVFYVQDTWGEKIVEEQKVEQLKQTLLRRLTSY